MITGSAVRCFVDTKVGPSHACHVRRSPQGGWATSRAVPLGSLKCQNPAGELQASMKWWTAWRSETTTGTIVGHDWVTVMLYAW